MVDFREINESLENSEERDAEDLVKVELITLSGLQEYEVEEGMTIKEFKEKHNLNEVKIVNEDGDVMRNNDIIECDSQFFISTPKKNG